MKSRAFLFLLLVALPLASQSEPVTQSIDKTSLAGASLENRFNSSANQPQNYSDGAVVSVSELSIPARARQEFDKANLALQKQDFAQARHRFGKAISIYPAFAGAYNNLAVAYARLGDHECEREALQKAIELNDHFELAYVNWARLEIASSRFANAESALSRAAALDENDSTAAILLAYTQMMEGHLEAAIASSQKAHSIGKAHAFTHRIAAYAFVQLHQLDHAANELQLAVEEDPNGFHGTAARNELEQLRATGH
jgi:Flp pilus assembly protein TadD